jgi:hypothetical protein
LETQQRLNPSGAPYRRAFFNLTSALEKRHDLAQRPQWARTGHDQIRPIAEWRFPGDRKRKGTFDRLSKSARLDLMLTSFGQAGNVAEARIPDLPPPTGKGRFAQIWTLPQNFLRRRA